ncbi:hypothetical protein EYF80_025356 [Liparis tanakae]|uniref:Uncharacterized protein n=1 Tax=Liparis tanakae TaxID=230148 RepID=A0A4Z2HFC1_9TELE|nr:hypothetical protein EYF80_025356 [Liparis tanakae]
MAMCSAASLQVSRQDMYRSCLETASSLMLYCRLGREEPELPLQSITEETLDGTCVGTFQKSQQRCTSEH